MFACYYSPVLMSTLRTTMVTQPSSVQRRAGALENVRLLLDAGADVNIRNTHGWTALNYAIFKGHEEIIALLHAAGGIAVSEDEI